MTMFRGAISFVSLMALALGLVVAVAGGAVAAGGGTPDTTFSSNLGGSFNSFVHGVAVQPDGKIVVGGGFREFQGETRNRMVRLNADGTLDTAFSTKIGIGFNDTVFGAAVQSDGKIVVGGTFTSLNRTSSNRIARLDADGTPDTTFSANIGSGFNSFVGNVTVQADGKSLIGGKFVSLNGATSNRIARLNTDGTPDTTFTTNIGSGFDNKVNDIAVQPDGKIVVVGNFTDLNGTANSGVARLNANGTPDTTFRFNTGVSILAFGVALQPDGKIVVGGLRPAVSVIPGSRVARLNADGSLDTSFSNNLGSGFNQGVFGVAVQQGGQIVAGGTFTEVDGVASNRVVRLNADGTPDSAFTTNVGSGLDNTVSVVALQPDGDILVAGALTAVNGVTSSRIARLDGTPSVTPTDPPVVPVEPPVVPPVEPPVVPIVPPVVPPVNPVDPVTELVVRAKSKRTALKPRKRTKIICSVKTNGKIKKVKVNCYLGKKKLKGQAAKRACKIVTKNFQTNAVAKVKPRCSVRLKVKAKIVAKAPGAPKSNWKRTWKAKKRPKISCAR